MGTEFLYISDPYGKECESKAVMVEFTDLVVDRSIMYPTSEGQPNDRGWVEIDGKRYDIVDVWIDGVWIHLMSQDTYDQNIAGKVVFQHLDWDIRYVHMRFRSAMYLLSSLAYKNLNATTRINQTYDDNSWIDIYKDDLTEENVKELENEANEIVSKGVEISNIYMSRDEFQNNPQLMDILKNRVPDMEKIRMFKIEGLPMIPDMGTQVKNTSEIGKINLKTSLLKGKINKRITITLS
jgi:alanyl-tRNA synthetase/misacylated tRNA(Ala) deacylase